MLLRSILPRPVVWIISTLPTTTTTTTRTASHPAIQISTTNNKKEMMQQQEQMEMLCSCLRYGGCGWLYEY